MPKDFVNGGWLFSAICVIGSLIATLYCAHLLLQCRAKFGGSFPEIGQAVYGKWGKLMVDISLVASQYGFVTAYIYFIASQIGGPGGVIPCITADSTDDMCANGTVINKWWFLLICCAIYIPLVFVRKIEVFAVTHVFGDAMIIITMIIICIYAGMDVGKDGWQPGGLQALNSQLWPDAIGFSVYTFEGIGVILPIMDITEKPEQYYKVLAITVTFIAFLYIAFTEYCVFAYGINKLEDPLITASLPPQSWVTYLVKVMFSLNLVFSYPLVIHPANIVIEDWLFKGWPKTRTRQMSKNVSRTIIVASSCVVALMIYDKLDRFLSVTGSLTCTPIAFILPALFHYGGVAETMTEKVIDIIIIVIALVIMLYCTTYAIIHFND